MEGACPSLGDGGWRSLGEANLAPLSPPSLLIYKGLWMGLQSRWVGSCGAGCGVVKGKAEVTFR